jgi:hypothetical protein
LFYNQETKLLTTLKIFITSKQITIIKTFHSTSFAIAVPFTLTCLKNDFLTLNMHPTRPAPALPVLHNIFLRIPVTALLHLQSLRMFQNEKHDFNEIQTSCLVSVPSGKNIRVAVVFLIVNTYVTTRLGMQQPFKKEN